MKDLIKTMRKVPLVHRLFYLIFCLYASASGAQTQISNEEYKVINAIFGSKDSDNGNKDTYIYEMTLFAKGWSYYFEDIERIFKNVGTPTTILDNKLREILDKDVLSAIHSAISKLKPYKLSSEKLNSIKLCDDFDSDKTIKNGVFRISKPIIINNKIAVVKKVALNESPIFILEKKDDKWKIIYTFYDWLVLN